MKRENDPDPRGLAGLAYIKYPSNGDPDGERGCSVESTYRLDIRDLRLPRARRVRIRGELRSAPRVEESGVRNAAQEKREEQSEKAKKSGGRREGAKDGEIKRRIARKKRRGPVVSRDNGLLKHLHRHRR